MVDIKGAPVTFDLDALKDKIREVISDDAVRDRGLNTVMDITRIDTYDDERFSKKVLNQHGAYLILGDPVESIL